LTGQELRDWEEYFDSTPFGQDHTDYLLAQLTAELSNRWRGKDEEARDIIDFLPYAEPRQQTAEEQLSIIRTISAIKGN